MLVVIQKDKAFGRQNLRIVLHVYHHNSALLVYHGENVGIRHTKSNGFTFPPSA